MQGTHDEPGRLSVTFSWSNVRTTGWQSLNTYFVGAVYLTTVIPVRPNPDPNSITCLKQSNVQGCHLSTCKVVIVHIVLFTDFFLILNKILCQVQTSWPSL